MLASAHALFRPVVLACTRAESPRKAEPSCPNDVAFVCGQSEDVPFPAPLRCQIGKLLVRFVSDEGDNHAVQVEEEHQQVETQLDERFLARCQLESLQIEAWKGK